MCRQDGNSCLTQSVDWGVTLLTEVHFLTEYNDKNTVQSVESQVKDKNLLDISIWRKQVKFLIS